MRAFVIVKVENKRFPEHISMGQIHSLLFSSGKYRIKCCLVHAGIVTLNNSSTSYCEELLLNELNVYE